MTWRNPFPTVDVIVETPCGVVLVRRRNPPPGWALPGGFVELGERVEDAAVREVLEETGLDVELTLLFGVYSDPSRDPRFHTMSVVYVGRASGTPRGGDDAIEACTFPPDDLPQPIAFDHGSILADYRRWRTTGALPRPAPSCPSCAPRGAVPG